MKNLNRLFHALLNGSKARKKYAYVQKCNFTLNVLEVLYREGYINGYSTNFKDKIRIDIKYLNKHKPAISRMVAISKNHHIRAITFNKLKYYIKKTPVGITIISTPKGVLSHRDCIKLGLGGILVALVL